MNNQEMKFFKHWFNQTEGDYECRLIADGGIGDKWFVAVEDINELMLAWFIEGGKQEGLIVYLSVAPRGCKFGTVKDVSYVPGLQLDIDPKHAAFEKAAQIVNQLPISPSNAISSGNGDHTYYKFNEPFAVNKLEDLQFIKELSKKLHSFINVEHMDVRTLGAILCFVAGFTGISQSKLKFIDAVIKNVIQVIEIDQAKMEAEMFMEACNAKDGFIYEHNNCYRENRLMESDENKMENHLQ
ncbi:hypothetical protein FITA111629_08505 [Filibacter tadaridae]|uniref:Uncharacterized protein n=1 Tax=Filibacter tadaridae TaxID=2483811 RepID=A0A3P5XBZ7_9BACL|nr:hypothetical protein [Filibacter tadaridae]VDC25989.1 hypothetical protein FILTAD_01406 [Filibacter tadaridae]